MLLQIQTLNSTLRKYIINVILHHLDNSLLYDCVFNSMLIIYSTVIHVNSLLYNILFGILTRCSVVCFPFTYNSCALNLCLIEGGPPAVNNRFQWCVHGLLSSVNRTHLGLRGQEKLLRIAQTLGRFPSAWGTIHVESDTGVSSSLPGRL